MNLFRSEEHVRNWSDFKEGTDEGILSLEDIVAIFSTPRHTKKMSRHYVSSMQEYKAAFIERIMQVKTDSKFWTL